MQIMKKA